MSRSLLSFLLGVTVAVALASWAMPAGACAQSPQDPCLEDRETSWVRGTVFTDRVPDGAPRAEIDLGRPGELVWVDVDEDAVPDADEPRARTDGDGRFAFEVDPGAFPAGSRPPLRVQVAAANACTVPDPCARRAPFVPGEDLEDQDFGIAIPAVLRGQANEDLDDDGVRDRDEPGALNLRLYVDLDRSRSYDRGEPTTLVPFHGAWDIEVPVTLLGRALTVRSENPQGFHCKRPLSCEETVPPLGAGEFRTLDQRMISEPAIVFVHGFLGSEIGCPGNKAWFDGLGADLLDMQLGPDGRSNMTVAQGGTRCSEQAGPTGGLILEAAGKDIYGSSVSHYAKLARAERFRAIAWDWRKDPRSQVHVLDRAIDELRCQGPTPCDAPRVRKVVLVAHSQGGLLSRAYVADPARAAKVSRLVTVGTPTWGSPKSIFPLVGGVETPIGGLGMDVFLDNDDLKVLARNLSGGFSLAPSPAYGPWLDVPTFSSTRMDADSAPDFYAAIGGNALLVRQQAQAHRELYDRFGSLNGVDYQVVAGRGMATITDVKLLYGADERVEATFGEGDQTVPLKSAEFDAPADRLHHVCGISHVPLTADPQTTAMIDPFVTMGEPVRPNPQGRDCPVAATVVNVYAATALGFDLTDPVATAASARSGIGAARVRARSAATGRATGPAMTPAQAQAAGLIDLVQAGGQTTIVVDDRRPVQLTVPADRSGKPYAMTTQDLDGSRHGPVRTFGDLTGATVLDAGAATTLRAGGRVLRPSRGAERDAPRTRAQIVRLAGGRVRVTLTTRDRSLVTGTYVFVGERRRRYRRPVVLTAAQARRASFASVDRWGNAEPRRPLRLR
ncbi:hypothetical protein GKE82_12445 [Conexibacter sp. W3-3-2]|uniref:esterase/lipase family protein n=1 Tax=Conexibacter sp. W3-3-2 TaxID=2675227 RepID=UPI0012BA30FA|nr:hypothetical protein [Conexibacter sp. W3-3-2]MTD45078.1 hypothetical protein [Conexibacter sp. W3-3-2]